MFRSNLYTEGQFFKPIPVFRQSVVPGQSVSLDLQIAFETDAFTSNILNGGMYAAYSFYCPYRLLWDQWMDFIGNVEGAPGNVPTSSQALPFLFERGANQKNVWARRAHKLIYNEYFGSRDDQSGNAFYPDVTDDAETRNLFLRTTDQFNGKLMKANRAPDSTYDAPVAGAVATISLNDFRQAMRNAQSLRRADMTGDKYVDAMRRMGVDLNWTMQMAPEVLGVTHREMDAKDTRAAFSGAPGSNPQTGSAFARYQERFQHKTGRKFFAEHGIILSYLAVRPFDFNLGQNMPPDAVPTSRDDYFLGDNNAGVDTWTMSNWTTSNQDAYAPRFQHLRSGSNLIGVNSPTLWFTGYAEPDLDGLIYPLLDVDQASQLQTGSQLAVFTRARSTGPTPVRANVL